MDRDINKKKLKEKWENYFNEKIGGNFQNERFQVLRN